MAKRKLKKKKPSGLRRAGRLLYRTIVVISAIIVALFVAWKAWARAPEQKAPPMVTVNPDRHPTDNPDTDDDESLNTPQPLVRKEGFYTFLLAASDVSGGNADTIMVVSYDTVNQKVGVVSIPRDTIVDRPDQDIPKINAAYRGKNPADNLRDTVSELVGFPIDYYITVSINAFKAIVDTVGGVDFYIPCDMNYDDTTPGQELRIHYTKGQYHLNGQQALEVVRFRHNNDGSGYTDVGRTQTQQKLLTAMAKKVLSWQSVTKLTDFVDIFAKYVRSDLDVSHMAWFATQALSLDTAEGVSSATLPGDGTVKYKGVSWCYALEPEETLDIFNRLLNPYTTDLTLDMTGIVIP